MANGQEKTHSKKVSNTSSPFFQIIACWDFFSQTVTTSLELLINRLFFQVFKTKYKPFEKDILFSTKDELLQNLKDQNITDARCIAIRWNGQVLPMKLHHSDFQQPYFTQRIKADYFNCSDLSVLAFLMITIALNVSVMGTLHITVVVSIFFHGAQKLTPTANPVKTLNAVRVIIQYTPILVQIESVKKKSLSLK